MRDAHNISHKIQIKLKTHHTQNDTPTREKLISGQFILVSLALSNFIIIHSAKDVKQIIIFYLKPLTSVSMTSCIHRP